MRGNWKKNRQRRRQRKKKKKKKGEELLKEKGLWFEERNINSPELKEILGVSWWFNLRLESAVATRGEGERN